jgi:hypothetical protein
MLFLLRTTFGKESGAKLVSLARSGHRLFVRRDDGVHH